MIFSANNSFSTTYDKSELERYGWKFDGVFPLDESEAKAWSISRQRALSLLSRKKSKEDSQRLHTKKLTLKQKQHEKI
jgi:hypothetical protein